MLTVKFIYTNGNEAIDGPFEHVSFSRQDSDGNTTNDGTGFGVVFALRSDNKSATYGPVLPVVEGEPRGIVEPVVYVMNERGATVATYHL